MLLSHSGESHLLSMLNIRILLGGLVCRPLFPANNA
jgi:hypothetical protein